ncbi:MAG: hypothetical protein RIC19_24780 [Phaeodactylibacter sp.]|uniref:hypothetical protein n=1 Tax=Phaeodactylibacter sp. TaxID=1940289 RepID=UPI0032EB6F25
MKQLKDFVVLKSLRVHKLEVKPGRVSATYEILHRDGSTATNVLFYTYNRSTFDKKRKKDLNLASMMVAQVALNYGLFCQELIFDGFYDKTDQDFIKSMVENTSREILTNKLLIDNPFLIEDYRGLQATRQDRYTQARIVFAQDTLPSSPGYFNEVKPDLDKYAILSSGGKDSLVSYGLIKEFGEPYPIFVNEAGRHWFTAVNSYRYFRETEPNTGKVWCNSDRIFNWMVKNLSFIKPNYASIRADIYPVRLWTVAVFLFGVLPAALKKGLGNVIVGDEYDTTERKTTNGISHYSALYDQSKYFDNALTRYYQKKGWNLLQYSMLRSMSELLIMKVLLKRYPDLQKQQISCHAAHERDKRMYPCGKCEKCRRITGMITALGEHPGNCGYTPDQIKVALAQLSNASVKQVGSDAAHLYHLLLSKGHIQANAFTKKLAREHPRVMQLRFDNERSDLADLPDHIRAPLFSILSPYSNGAIQKKENGWQELELNHSFLSSKPYKYNV